LSGADSVIFDLDISERLNEILSSHAPPPVPLADARMMIGGGAHRLPERAWRLICAGACPDIEALAQEFIDVYERRRALRSRPYPPASKTLGALTARRVAIGLCTNKPEAVSRSILQAFGRDSYFGAIVGGDATPAKKPDPVPVFATLKGLERSATGALLVGDSAQDLGAARAAGLKCVPVSREPVETFGADGVVDSLQDALKHVV
jgi:phosphoglycolate phosphatase